LPVDVILVDARNYHTFQPLLYQVATAGLDGEDVCYPVRAIFGRQRNARIIMGEVVGGDLAARRIDLADGASLDYDELVLAPGAVTNSFGTPGVDRYAFGLKSLGDALRLRSHVLTCFERAEANPELIDGGMLTFVVAGGGPTGVELCGGLAELIDRPLRRDFSHLDVGKAKIILVEATDRLLRMLSPRSSESARSALGKRGVEVKLNAGVAEVGIDRVGLVDGTAIRSRTLVWAAGIKAHPLAASFGLETGRGGRVIVDDYLCVPGRPEVHAIGDLAASLSIDGSVIPQVAPVAIQGGKYTAWLIGERMQGRKPSPFRYRDKGTMATIGRHSAVAELPIGLKLGGAIGWAAWLLLHLIMLIGFRNRANVLVNWAWSYLTFDRASRIIIQRDETMTGTVVH
jgi:NADH dehydrogenase